MKLSLEELRILALLMKAIVRVAENLDGGKGLVDMELEKAKSLLMHVIDAHSVAELAALARVLRGMHEEKSSTIS